MPRPALDRKMQLSLDEETWQTLKALAEVMDKPAATLVREILRESVPSLRESIKMFRNLKKGLLTQGIEEGMETARQAAEALKNVQMQLSEVQANVPADVDPTEVRRAWDETMKKTTRKNAKVKAAPKSNANK